MNEANVHLVKTYIAAVERFDTAAVSTMIGDAMVQTEFPNKLYAAGQKRSKADMMRDLPKGAKVLRSQAYPIETIFGAGDKVAVETTWKGVLNVRMGRLKPGDEMVAHISMVFTVRDGRIVAQRNYDCYEDFA